MAKAEEILKAASVLSHQERAWLASELLQQLDSEDDTIEAWESEILRRSREIADGVVKPIPWDSVQAEGRSIIDRHDAS